MNTAASNIVVGLDATEHDDAVGEWVARFASTYGTHVIIVHVVRRTILWLIAAAQADSAQYVNAMRDRFERQVIAPLRVQGVSAEFRLALGDPAHQLADTAAERGADLLVIGGAEHSALHDVVAGSIARRLERHTDVPVVIVPHTCSRNHDRSDPSSNRNVRPAESQQFRRRRLDDRSESAPGVS